MRFDLEKIRGILLPRKENFVTPHIRKHGRLAWNEKFNSVPFWSKIRPGWVVFDIGAFIGDTAQFFLNKECEVHAFEPIPEHFICLLNNCPKAHCYNVAVGDGTRYKTVFMQGNTGGTWLRPGSQFSIRIDDLKPPQLDILKIDVEGFEDKVLAGAAETIRKLHPVIHIELNKNGLARFGATPNSVRENLISLGYKHLDVVQQHNEGYNSHCDLLCR
jgi:FkbM family methyltransferase